MDDNSIAKLISGISISCNDNIKPVFDKMRKDCQKKGIYNPDIKNKYKKNNTGRLEMLCMRPLLMPYINIPMVITDLS